MRGVSDVYGMAFAIRIFMVRTMEGLPGTGIRSPQENGFRAMGDALVFGRKIHVIPVKG